MIIHADEGGASEKRLEGGTTNKNVSITGPAPEAKQWQGWGTEHWILVRKPCSEDTVANGTGGINIDASRIAGAPTSGSGANRGNKVYGEFAEKRIGVPNVIILSHNPDCVETCTEGCAVAELDKQSLAGGMHSAGWNGRRTKPKVG